MGKNSENNQQQINENTEPNQFDTTEQPENKKKNNVLIISAALIIFLYIIFAVPSRRELKQHFNDCEVVCIDKFDDLSRTEGTLEIEDPNINKNNYYLVMHDKTNNYDFVIIDAPNFKTVNIGSEFIMDQYQVIDTEDHTERLEYRFIK